MISTKELLLVFAMLAVIGYGVGYCCYHEGYQDAQRVCETKK